MSKKKTKKKTAKKKTAKAAPASSSAKKRKKATGGRAASKPAAKKQPSRKQAPKKRRAAATSKKKTAGAVKKKAAKPRKPAVDPALLRTIRHALIRQRDQLLSVVQSTRAQMARKEVGLADVSDRASGGYEDELALGLMKIEAAQIDDIEAAIARIDEGVYGICVDCGKLIPRKRLEVLPFAQRCLACKDLMERKARIKGLSGNYD